MLTKKDLNEALDLKLKPIHDDIKVIKGDITQIKGDITVIKKDVKKLRKDLDGHIDFTETVQTNLEKRVKIVESVLKIPTPDFI